MLLENDAVLLAGATGKVGGAALRTFVEEGARVLVLSRSEDRARKAIEEYVPEAGRGNAVPFGADLSKPESAQQAVDEAVRRFGRLDAAITLVAQSRFVPLVESTLDDLTGNLDANLLPNYNLLIPALRAMLRQPFLPGARSRGRIVAVSAGSSKDPQPRFGLFGASKAALNILVQAIAREHKADGIVANAIVLGGVATEQAKSYLSQAEYEAAAQPEEVAAVLAFLAAGRATGVNGALVDVNAREVD